MTAIRSAPGGAVMLPAQRFNWRLLGVILFACLNLAALGVFFAVFVGLLVAPPDPRHSLFALVAGSLAFAVLALGQFVHWSRIALKTVKGRRS